MFKNLLFFIFGLAIAATASFYHFSEMIIASGELNKLVANNQVNYFKSIHSENASKLITGNNKYIQKAMSGPLTEENIAASQLLLASSLFLSSITDQSDDTKAITFIAMTEVYAKTKSELEISELLPSAVDYCKKHTHFAHCSSDALLKILLDIKAEEQNLAEKNGKPDDLVGLPR